MLGRFVRLGVLACAWAPFAWSEASAANAKPGESIALSGSVVYSDAEWRQLFVVAGPEVVLVEPVADGLLPSAGRRAEVAGQSGRVRGLRAITSAKVRDLGEIPPPETAEISLARGIQGGARWVRLTAFVRRVDVAERRLFLKLAAGSQLLDAHVPVLPSPPARLPEAGSELTLRGVLEPAADPWSRPQLWVAGWADIEEKTAAPAWAALPTVTVEQALARWRSGAPAGETRLRLRAIEQRSAHSFVLEDGSGRLAVEMGRPIVISAGSWCDVRGFLTSRRGTPLLADAQWQLHDQAALASRREPGLPALGSVKLVRALPRAEAERGYPVKLRAIVTYSEPNRNRLFVQDETAGLFLHLDYRDLGVHAGDEVVVEGFTAPGALAPLVLVSRLVSLGRARLPQAQPSSVSRLGTGVDDCRRVETTAVVRSVRRIRERIEIGLAAEGRRLRALVPLTTGVAVDESLVGGRLRVRGVCGTRFNWRGQIEDADLYVARGEDLTPVDSPPTPPYVLPPTAIRDVFRGADDPHWGRRVRVRGVVLHHRAGQPLYLRDASGTAIVEALPAQPLVPGDLVDVVGFPAVGAVAPRLEDAVFQLRSHGPAPLPAEASVGQLLGGALDAELVSVATRLLDTVRREDGTSLLLQADEAVFEAVGDGDLPDSLQLQPGSRLAVTGVLLVHRAPGEEPILRLVLRSPEDVRVISRPPWWTAARAAWAVFGLAAVLLVAFGWLSTLRRQVRKQTVALRTNEERYRLLADHASDVIFTLDPRLCCTYVSPSGLEQTGYPAEELLGTPFDRLLSAESRTVLASALEPLQTAGGPQASLTLELEVIGKDGAWRWFEVRLAASRDVAGRLVTYVGIARDVTARRRVQQELARLAAAVEQAAEAIVLTDPDAVILYVNPAFERITGYPATEAVGSTTRLLRSGVHDRAFYDGMWSTIRSGKTWEGRFTNRRKDGEFFIEDASIAPIRERQSDRLIGYVAVKRDVTRQVQIENHLAQTQKMEAIGRLAAGVAHDFNNVLAAIVGFADLSLRKAPAESPLVPYLNGIRDAALRAAGLTRQILTFSRQTSPELRPLELRPVIEEAVRLLRALLPANVEIRTRLESSGVVAADPTQIHQVVLNLGTNGGLAMRESGGLLEITLADVELDATFAERHPPLEPGRFVTLSVMDGGSGMSPELIERVFEPFFTTRGYGEGTGMGLAVVHGIVDRHGGLITAESTAGRGATFSVFLPVVPEGPPARDSAEPPLPRGSERILLVDDEPALSKLGEEMLSELGYSVAAFTSPALALDHFKAEPQAFDLAMVDLSMPGLPGDALAREILRVRAIPVIVCTGYSERFSEPDAAAMGVAAFVLKPLSLHDLASTVRAALDRHRT